MFKVPDSFTKNTSAMIKHDYKILNHIAKGTNSNVKQVRHRETGELFAVKIFNRRKLTDYKLSCAQREAAILSQLTKCKNIIQYQDFFMDDSYLCIVTDVMSMSLMDYLNDHYDRLSRADKLAIFVEIVKAVDHCHEHAIMHRDIKLENVLVRVDQDATVTEVRLADFGFACASETLSSTENFCGSIPYMAPEQLEFGQTYDSKVDVWGLGHILFELMTGEHLFDEDLIDEGELIANSIKNEPVNLERYDLTVDERSLLQSILEKNQKMRISTKEILKCPLLYRFFNI